ncbi:MAG: hypothetical protein ACE5I1_11740, partial [bacterium]
MTVTGTYYYWFPAQPSAMADAEWAETTAIGDSGWTNAENSLFELLVNDQDIDWGLFNTGHVYSHEIIANGDPISFRIFDDYYGDNNGSLFV